MGFYRKKPVIIEARQLCTYNMEHIEDWCGGRIRGTKLPVQDRIIQIDTLEGEMEAKIGDWIIKGLKGEFYPCKPEIFELSYDEE